MPLPSGQGFNPPGGGNVDFGGMPEALSALQRNPQVRRAIGFGTQNVTGSVIYAVIPAANTVTITDNTAFMMVAAPGIVVPFGVPTINPVSGGSLTITPANSSTFYTVLYK